MPVLGGPELPALIAGAGERAAWRFLEFFTVNIRNKNTRAAYGQAAGAFLRWCEDRGITRIEDVRPVHVAGYIEQLQAVRSAPTVKQHLARIRMLFDWLVTGQVVQQPDGRLRVDFRLWDVFGQSQMLGLQFFTTPENWRRIAHMVSDAVYERVTGEKGYFDTRIVFVAESGPKAKRIRRLAIMDQDGANPSYLTDGSYMVFTPRFSSNSQEITFMALRPTGASIYLLLKIGAAVGVPLPEIGAHTAGRTLAEHNARRGQL